MATEHDARGHDDIRLLGELPADTVPPRRNGELVFERPWQSRAFGIAAALSEHGALRWDEFRAELIAAIAGTARSADGEYPYYECWLAALEKSVLATGLLIEDDLRSRTRTVLAQAPDADHRHDSSRITGG